MAKATIGAIDWTEVWVRTAYVLLPSGLDTEAPAKTIHYSAEGTIEFRALLYIPAHKPFDLMCCDAIADDVDELLKYSSRDLVRLAGSQGVELLSWLVMRGAMLGTARRRHFAYHGAVSNTAAAVMLLTT